MNEISTDNAPEAIGPYSQGIVNGNTVFVSGQGPVNPETETIESETIEDETAQTLDNIAAILDAAGTSLDRVVKANVYLDTMDTYDAVNTVYREYMSEPYPARTAVEIVDLPVDIGVEIEVTAALD